MPPTDRVQLECPAKVNLALSIASPLANGYHPLASWMVALHFADRLTLHRLDATESDTGASRFDITFADDAPVRGVVDWHIEKDLAFRAHGLVEAQCGRKLPVRMTLDKRIPTGAGLGGGSSDAAAMLVALDRLYDLQLGRETLCTLGGKLGSDVAFLVAALLGKPSAIVTGLGETLEPSPMRGPLHLVLIFPKFGCPTGEVYRAFDQAHPATQPRTTDVARVRRLTAMSPLPPDAPFNDLAGPACSVRPELGRLQQSFTQSLAVPVHVTGSGSTLFLIGPDETAAATLAKKATAVSGLAAIATHTIA